MVEVICALFAVVTVVFLLFPDAFGEHLARIADAFDAALAQVAKLRNAATPFVNLADDIDALCATTDRHDPNGWAKACSYEDLCAIRAALNGE